MIRKGTLFGMKKLLRTLRGALFREVPVRVTTTELQ